MAVSGHFVRIVHDTNSHSYFPVLAHYLLGEQADKTAGNWVGRPFEACRAGSESCRQ